MSKGRLPLLIALVLGALAGAVAWGTMKKNQHDIQKGWNLVPVLVVGRDVPEGTVLTPDMIAQRSIPEQFVTDSVMTPAEIEYLSKGVKVLVRLQAGDPVLWSHFQNTRQFERLSNMVHRQARAVNMTVDRVQSVGGWVRPNDHVDVVGTFRDPATRELVSVTLLQNIIVLATGKLTGTTNPMSMSESERNYNTVSVLVLPEEVEILTLAGELGKLTLSLRNPEDIDFRQHLGAHTSIRTLLTGERIQQLHELRKKAIPVIEGTKYKVQYGPWPK